MASRDLYETARALRPHLPELLGVRQAAELDARLGALLEQPPSAATMVGLTRLLSSNDATRAWVKAARATDADVEMGYSVPPGRTQSLPPLKYSCPVIGCAEIAFVEFAGQSIDDCPIHACSLVPR